MVCLSALENSILEAYIKIATWSGMVNSAWDNETELLKLNPTFQSKTARNFVQGDCFFVSGYHGQYLACLGYRRVSLHNQMNFMFC